MDNSETQDNVETTATENIGVESQEIKEWGEQEQQPEQEQEVEKTEAQEQEEAQKAEKKSRFTKRVQELNARALEAERKLAEYESKAKVSELKRPVVDDFEDFGKYEEALEDYQIARAEERVLAKINERESSKSQQTKEVEMQSAIAELEEQGIDFNTYAQKAEALPVLPIQLDQFGLSATETLKLAKDLLDDEDTYIAISQMNPVQAAMKIGQIIESKKTKTPPPVSKAPKPLKPVQANAPASRTIESMGDAEAVAALKKLRKGK